MKTQIIGVLGLGIFGQTLATELSSFGQDVIALDNNSTTIDFLADQVTKAATFRWYRYLRYSHYCNWRTLRIFCTGAPTL